MDALVAQFLDEIPVGVIATIRDDGKPRLSTVYFLRDGDSILISTESKRGKARDAERTGYASMCVQGLAKPFPCVTVEGRARVLREGVGEPTARLMAHILGTPVGVAQTDEELAAVDRVILELSIDRIYGASYLEAKP
jgi:PPOX class probable F420-dependent enzyme